MVHSYVLVTFPTPYNSCKFHSCLIESLCQLKRALTSEKFVQKTAYLGCCRVTKLESPCYISELGLLKWQRIMVNKFQFIRITLCTCCIIQQNTFLIYDHELNQEFMNSSTGGRSETWEISIPVRTKVSLAGCCCCRYHKKCYLVAFFGLPSRRSYVKVYNTVKIRGIFSLFLWYLKWISKKLSDL